MATSVPASGLLLLRILVFILAVPPAVWCPGRAFRVTEGSTVVLSCHYSVQRHGPSHVCWGRDCGTFWCHDIIVQTDQTGVVSKVSDRYRLIGDVLSGQMDLAVQRLRRGDSGRYCCRVDIEGLFNDKKVSYTLKVIKAPTTVPPTTTTVQTTALMSAQTGRPDGTDSSAPDVSSENITLAGAAVAQEEAVASLTLQINMPVLSLSLSLLSVLLGALAVLAFKRGVHRKAVYGGCLSKEPPHIIYEIRTRRPVEENIYTLD